MLVLTIDESSAWLAERGFQLVPAPHRGADHRVEIPPTHNSVYFGTPQDARTLLDVAHLLSVRYTWHGALLVICVVSSFEDYELEAFLSLRRSYGDNRWADGVPGGATPGQLFSDDEVVARRDLRELLAFMMAYTFEGYFVQQHGETTVWLGDDAVEISSRREADLEEARNVMRTLGLEPTEWAQELMRRRRTRG